MEAVREEPAAPRKPRGRTGIVVAAGLAACAAVAVVLAMGGGSKSGDEASRARPPQVADSPPSPRPPAQEPSAATAAPTVAERPAAHEPPPPKTVTVRLSSVPSGADVWIADEADARGKTPMAISLGAGAPATRVTFKAPSYASKVVVVDGSRDTEISAELQKEKKLKEPKEPKEPKGPAGHHKHETESESAPVFKAVGD
jgi:hypothetical protein